MVSSQQKVEIFSKTVHTKMNMGLKLNIFSKSKSKNPSLHTLRGDPNSKTEEAGSMYYRRVSTQKHKEILTFKTDSNGFVD